MRKQQDPVHGVRHHRADRLHDDRRNTDRIDRSDDFDIRTKSMKMDLNLGIELVIAGKGNDSSDTLTDDSCHSGTG